MEPKKKESKFKSVFVLLIPLALAGLFILIAKPSIYGDLKNAVLGSNKIDLIETIKKEISNSGKLILPGDNPSSYLTYEGTLKFTNEERTTRGLKALSPNQKLNQIAKIRMDDMFAKDYFEHVSPTGDSAAKEADTLGYEYISIGENIALGDFADDRGLVTAWMNSPGHRANILNTKYAEIGIAVGKGEYQGRQTWIAVQVFGKPLSACPSVDSGLKQKIDSLSKQVDSNKAELDRMQAELENMSHDSKTDRQEYNQKVDEYNNLAKETNALIEEIKADVSTYNSEVRSFNACLDSST